MATALSQSQRTELRDAYREAQFRYEGARQMASLVLGRGHLSPNALQALEEEIETLRKRAAAAFKAHNEAVLAFNAELAERMAALNNVTCDEAGRYHIIGTAEVIRRYEQNDTTL